MTLVLPQNLRQLVTVTESIQPLIREGAPSIEEMLSKISEHIEQNYDDGFDPVSFDQQLIEASIAPILSHVTGYEPVQSIAATWRLQTLPI